MCGIFGAINLHGFYQAEDFKRFVDVTDIVRYRGPDASGYLAINSWEKRTGREEKFDVFLGHRRLAIIDLSDAGRQPFTDDHDLWIVFNGEIFNYIELRDELRAKGHTFRTDTDTEVILKVYREYGEDGFKLLNGMWAFIIMDSNAGRVVISRDRFSIKPLYYTRSSSYWYIASEIKQFLPLIGTKQINTAVMEKFLRQGLLDYNEETFFDNIYKIKPKTNVVIDLKEGTITEKIYWEYTSEVIHDENQAYAAFNELFLDSIKIRLRSDVKVGALLSGGLDSSAITAIANDISGSRLDSFSIVSSDRIYSEERFIDILAQRNKIKNTKLLFKPEKALGMLDNVISAQDEPFTSFSVVAQNLIFKEIKEKTDITVILSGQGGDEILMGYLKYFFFNVNDLLKKRKMLKAVKQLASSLLYRTAIWQFRVGSAKRYIPFLIKKKIEYIDIPSNLEEVWRCNDLRDRQILDIDKYSVPALTHYEDRNSMSYSLEVRHPFLDHRIVNLLLNMPTSFKIKNGWTKYILRRTQNNLPDEIRWRRDKQGFITPEEIWLRRDLKDYVIQNFEKSVLSEMGIINSKAFLLHYENYVRQKRNVHHSEITRMLIAEMWAKHIYA